MEKNLTLFHGSSQCVEQPRFGVGNPHNDFGLGFYCTPYKDLAMEWACPDQRDGFVNCYTLPTKGLKVLDLEAEDVSVLQWLAVLLKYRHFEVSFPLAIEGKKFVLDEYSISLDGYDVVSGYRADDSYFSFARAFLNNTISLEQLEQAMRFGQLGTQIVLKSEKAFKRINFLEAQNVPWETWYPRRTQRDDEARKQYQALKARGSADAIYLVDILREGRSE